MLKFVHASTDRLVKRLHYYAQSGHWQNVQTSFYAAMNATDLRHVLDFTCLI